MLFYSKNAVGIVQAALGLKLSAFHLFWITF
jgi:hypothetical protein